MTNVTMKAGQITAKLRDAVPVGFYEDESERAQYKNIDIPDSLKELEITDFGFHIVDNAKISFRLFFAPGILPVEFPAAREKMTRAEKAAAKAALAEEAATAATEDAAAETAEDTTGNEETADTAGTDEPAADTEITEAEAPQPDLMETRFNVTGDQRKALVAAVESYLGGERVYKGAPSYAYAVSNYIIDRTGTLIGEPNPELLVALAEQGFTPNESDAA